jgi:hypothetical protein
MSSTIQVEAARIPDRDTLLELLKEHGLDARSHNEMGIEVLCVEESGPAADEVFSEVSGLIMNIGAPFVPIKHEGVVYVRPPVG